MPSYVQLNDLLYLSFAIGNFFLKLVKLYMTKLFIFAENIDIKEVNYGKW